jgi:hypothetical protein
MQATHGMSANQKRKTYCVWNNETDQLVALDETADKCAERMGIKRNVFYQYMSGKINNLWTILRSEDIESEDEQ